MRRVVAGLSGLPATRPEIGLEEISGDVLGKGAGRAAPEVRSAF
jgi:hypothetical protein